MSGLAGIAKHGHRLQKLPQRLALIEVYDSSLSSVVGIDEDERRKEFHLPIEL